MSLANKPLGKKPEIDERSGQESLRGHIIDKANEARLRYGPYWDFARMQDLLQDPQCVRFPVEISFNACQLQQGEFAFMQQRDPDNAKNGPNFQDLLIGMRV